MNHQMQMQMQIHGARPPFTPSQWQELEHQALIFKYMVAGIPVPPDLLVPIRKSLEAISAGLFHPHHHPPDSKIAVQPFFLYVLITQFFFSLGKLYLHSFLMSAYIITFVVLCNQQSCYFWLMAHNQMTFKHRFGHIGLCIVALGEHAFIDLDKNMSIS